MLTAASGRYASKTSNDHRRSVNRCAPCLRSAVEDLILSRGGEDGDEVYYLLGKLAEIKRQR
jgi:hypothetical protein